MNSKTNNDLKDVFRPSHADYTYIQKYGTRDHRGGGRSSARETIARVVAGDIAKLLLQKAGVQVNAFVSRVGEVELQALDDLDGQADREAGLPRGLARGYVQPRRRRQQPGIPEASDEAVDAPHRLRHVEGHRGVVRRDRGTLEASDDDLLEKRRCIATGFVLILRNRYGRHAKGEYAADRKTQYGKLLSFHNLCSRIVDLMTFY